LLAAHRTIGGQNHQGMDGSVVLTVVLIESAGSSPSTFSSRSTSLLATLALCRLELVAHILQLPTALR